MKMNVVVSNDQIRTINNGIVVFPSPFPISSNYIPDEKYYLHLLFHCSHMVSSIKTAASVAMLEYFNLSITSLLSGDNNSSMCAFLSS